MGISAMRTHDTVNWRGCTGVPIIGGHGEDMQWGVYWRVHIMAWVAIGEKRKSNRKTCRKTCRKARRSTGKTTGEDRHQQTGQHHHVRIPKRGCKSGSRCAGLAATQAATASKTCTSLSTCMGCEDKYLCVNRKSCDLVYNGCCKTPARGFPHQYVSSYTGPQQRTSPYTILKPKQPPNQYNPPNQICVAQYLEPVILQQGLEHWEPQQRKTVAVMHQRGGKVADTA